ncbi:hypothetical protein QNO26_09345 [Microbacterium wangruii]|nr:MULTISPECIES: hypothetical protein [unclassified Microbacterium]MCR2811516.1 hypothetical protein [Microbacterium sp. zg.Y1084]WIM27369.1 hypothetical protein QNO26_09345 [Microbacterium sp. zg-Y1090]
MLKAQRAGVPSSVRAGLLVAFVGEWEAMEAQNAELLAELESMPEAGIG